MENDQLEFLDDEAQHIFSNMVFFRVNPEEVCIGLGIRDVQDVGMVKVQNYVHMTIPHFLRFADTVNKQVELLVDKGVISRETEQ